MQESIGRNRGRPCSIGSATSTVQAPQSPSAHMILVPTSPSRPRSQSLSVMKASPPRTSRRVPLTQTTRWSRMHAW